MVNLTPPPEGMQDRKAYDYLYQLQEYLSTVLSALGAGTTAAPVREEWTEESNVSTREWVNKIIRDFQAEIARTLQELETELDDYMKESDADVKYLTQTAFGIYCSDLEEALDELHTDYVMDTGTDAGWNWRKWSGGDVEMWGRWDLTAGEAPGTQTIPWPTGIIGETVVLSAGNPDPTGASVQVENVVPGASAVSFTLTAGSDPTLPSTVITAMAHGREDQA